MHDRPIPGRGRRGWAVALAAALLAVVAAGQSEPRFRLPEDGYDYTTISAFPGLPGLSLPERSDADPDGRLDARAALGRVLFHDDLLSKNRRRACASCHEQERAFADGRARSRGFRGRPTKRNSMSIVNLAFHDGPLFWDGRAQRLEQMVLMPIEDPIEMGLGLDELVERLSAEPGYPELFDAAFGSPEPSASRVGDALAAFVRAITSFRSRYDAGLARVGDESKDFPNFSAAENRGKRLYFGDGRPQRSCAACHSRLRSGFCGNTAFAAGAHFESTACRNNGLDRGRRGDDPGFGAVTGQDRDRGRFRAPSLRNVEVTGPYMHDGRFRTLEEVVAFYATGVQTHPGLDSVLRAGRSGGWGGGGLPTDVVLGGGVGPHTITAARHGFPMSSQDQEDLVAFLKTLTDRELLEDPRFSDPFVR